MTYDTLKSIDVKHKSFTERDCRVEKFARMALLADFYGPLLTGKQRNVWDLHYQQDLSLAEIAASEQISRQAVHDLLKRTEKILSEYEDKLGLVERFWHEREKLHEVKMLLTDVLAGFNFDSGLRPKLETVLKQIDEVFADLVI